MQDGLIDEYDTDVIYDCNILGGLLDLFSYKNGHSATNFDHIAQSFIAWSLQRRCGDAHPGR